MLYYNMNGKLYFIQEYSFLRSSLQFYITVHSFLMFIYCRYKPNGDKVNQQLRYYTAWSFCINISHTEE